jgi:small-conductance mechanosensitive channel
MAAGLGDLQGIVRALGLPSTWFQVALIGGCLLAAWIITNQFFKRDPSQPRSVWSSRRAASSLAFPVIGLALVLLVGWALQSVVPMPLTQWVVPVLASLVVVRILARTFRALFPDSSVARSIEKTFSWIIWGALALWMTGLLPVALREAQNLTWQIGGAPVSLRSLIEAAISGVVVMLLALWLSSLLEAKLLARADAKSLSLRKIAANGVRALLLLVGLLMALTAAGIPVGALGVFGGAIGVGIGLGLQKLAANYVSGFVILAERSLRIGDVVKIDGFEGRISDIATRYTVVRSDDGRESIVPNEMLVTQRVENHSLSDRLVQITSSIFVSYDTDVSALIPSMQLAMAKASPRVLQQPACQVQLSAFTASGIELQMSFWINDPEQGQGRVRGDVNLAVLDLLRSKGVTLPRQPWA